MEGRHPIRVRRRYEARGLVQGVGFRPFVYCLATELGLGGRVLNHSSGACVEVEGPPELLDRFAARLTAELPVPGRIDSLDSAELAATGQREFGIEASETQAGEVALVLADLATCDACRAELLDPADRRFGYAFTNCTHCGPRFTIIRDVPYDRAATTMAGFALCPDCRREYDDPRDRRFHAQPNACPKCGPALRWCGADGEAVNEPDPIAAAARMLLAGQIVAVKGLGGYHLACDAADDAAVLRLRERKRRDARPLAVMVLDLAAARDLAEVSDHEAELLASPAAPIVLCRRLPGAPLAPSLAPGLDTVGLMLAYTPLHLLLLGAVGRPLVMTSGNLSDEPIATSDDDALRRLGPIADGFLLHNRPIERRCDDSVLRLVGGRATVLRRSRGEAPKPILLRRSGGPVVLAVGGHQKNTFCLARGHEAFMSHHVGDLENDLALSAFETGIADYERLFGLRPEVIAHDLHPDYLATQYALDRAVSDGLETVGIQHHHAHIASCLADRGRDGPVIGLGFDGTGWGPDGTVWGGEVLVADLSDYRRVGRLRPFAMPGGEVAVRQGWRLAMALAYDADVFLDPSWLEEEPQRIAFVGEMLEGEVRCPRTSSLGRLFDGFSALLGLRTTSRYEGEAAVRLEGAAADEPSGALPFEIGPAGELHELDWRAAVGAAIDQRARGTYPEVIARRFHEGLAEGFAALCARVRRQTGLATVALSGGCFQNVLLSELLSTMLARRGFEILSHHRVPANDGGLSLGQSAIARERSG